MRPLENMGIINFLRRFSNRKKSSGFDVDSRMEVDRSKWTGNDFEFLISGYPTIANDDFETVMTPNTFEWSKVIKNDWVFYVVGSDEYSFSFEIPGIQFTFNQEVKYPKAKKIADEIIENINANGQKAELRVLDTRQIHSFK